MKNEYKIPKDLFKSWAKEYHIHGAANIFLNSSSGIFISFLAGRIIAAATAMYSTVMSVPYKNGCILFPRQILIYRSVYYSTNFAFFQYIRLPYNEKTLVISIVPQLLYIKKKSPAKVRLNTPTRLYYSLT